MSNGPRFTVIIPCFNEEGAIRHTIDSLRKDLGDPQQYELLVVNDGSSDRSGEILEALVKEAGGLRVVTHENNQGYGAALKTGIRRARTPLLVITDADGTYPNHRIPELVGMAESASADMLVGARVGEDVEYSKIRKIPKIFLRRWVSFLVGRDVPDMNSGLRVFRKDVAERYLRLLPDSFSFTTTITIALIRNRFNVIFTPISYKMRIGKSHIKPIRDTIRFTQLILRTGMYFAPLRVLAPVIGVLLILFAASACYDVFVAENLTDKTVMLLMFSMNTGIFALLADMIDKRGNA